MNNKIRYSLLIVFTILSLTTVSSQKRESVKGITVGYAPIAKLELVDSVGQFNFDNIRIGYEYEKNTFTARFDIYIKDHLISDENVTSLIGLRGGVGIILNANKRFQFPIYGTIGVIEYSNRELKYDIAGYSFGLRVGSKFFLTRKIALNLGLETEMFSETWENRQVAYVYGAFTSLSFTF